MLRGLYTATAGMIALQRRHDTITNNIANVNTAGYKQGETVQRSFPEMLISRLERLDRGGPRLSRARTLGHLPHGVLAEETIYNFAQGDIVETGNPFHVALWDDDLPEDPETGVKPHAFYVVQTADGVMYTRNGEWTLDADNTLVTGEGFPVLDAGGNPIVIPDASNFHVGEDGTVTFAGPDGAEEEAALGIAVIANPDLLIRRGNGLFEWTGDDAPAAAAEGVTTYQGYTERANVNPQQAAVDLMLTEQLYEANQRVIQAYDRSLDQAVNDVGRLV